MSSAYPVFCTETVGDARYPQGDLVAASVAVRGSGLRFSWTTAQAPYLFPGDEIIYSATFKNDAPALVATLYADLLNNAGKTTPTINIITPTNNTIDIATKASFSRLGSTFTVTVPQSRLGGFTGDAHSARLRDGSVLTTGRWTLSANRGPTAGSAPGTDDICGEDNRNQLH